MAKETTSGADAPKSKLELAKDAQVEVQETLTSKRIDFLETYQEFESIGGEDNVEAGILKIVEHFKEGIPYPFLLAVFPEISLLKAREALKKQGKIQQIGKKGKVVIKLAEAK